MQAQMEENTYDFLHFFLPFSVFSSVTQQNQSSLLFYYHCITILFQEAPKQFCLARIFLRRKNENYMKLFEAWS